MGNTLLRYLGRLWIKVSLQLGYLLYHLEITGAENLPTKGPCIVLINHPSRLDFIPIVFLLHTRPDSYVFAGWRKPGPPTLFRNIGIGAIPVHQDAGIKACGLWAALKVLQQGHPIVVAPEGGIRWDNHMRVLQPGAAWLALRSRAPVIVCVLRGGYAIWPRRALFPKLTGKLEIRIGKPLTLPKASDRKIDAATIYTANQRIAEEMTKLEKGHGTKV